MGVTAAPVSYCAAAVVQDLQQQHYTVLTHQVCCVRCARIRLQARSNAPLRHAQRNSAGRDGQQVALSDRDGCICAINITLLRANDGSAATDNGRAERSKARLLAGGHARRRRALADAGQGCHFVWVALLP